MRLNDAFLSLNLIRRSYFFTEPLSISHVPTTTPTTTTLKTTTTASTTTTTEEYYDYEKYDLPDEHESYDDDDENDDDDAYGINKLPTTTRKQTTISPKQPAITSEETTEGDLDYVNIGKAKQLPTTQAPLTTTRPRPSSTTVTTTTKATTTTADDKTTTSAIHPAEPKPTLSTSMYETYQLSTEESIKSYGLVSPYEHDRSQNTQTGQSFNPIIE